MRMIFTQRPHLGRQERKRNSEEDEIEKLKERKNIKMKGKLSRKWSTVSTNPMRSRMMTKRPLDLAGRLPEAF